MKMQHKFFEFIPDELENGILYVSIIYATVLHKCCCGCGNEVVTPLSPSDWQLTFDGETISLIPSIGNWSFPCRSHYWIEKNEIKWAEDWTDEMISLSRRWDAHARNEYYKSKRKWKLLDMFRKKKDRF